MSRTIAVSASILIASIALVYWLFAMPRVADSAIPDSMESIARGRYLVDAGGCVSCHEGTEHPQSLSGGLALESGFGTFYVPNITPDSATGIGGWSGKDFLLALKHGRSPAGGFYFPAFPYPAYAGMTDQDVLDIAAYLLSLPEIEFTAPNHEVPIWLRRWTISGWNVLTAILRPQLIEESDPKLARGAYLARSLGHCGECHTPRNSLGIPDLDREFAGASSGGGGGDGDGDGNDEVEAIDAEALAQWSAKDFVNLLSYGLKPDGEFVGGEMEKVVEHNTSKLTKNDQQALAAFFTRH